MCIRTIELQNQIDKMIENAKQMAETGSKHWQAKLECLERMKADLFKFIYMPKNEKEIEEWLKSK